MKRINPFKPNSPVPTAMFAGRYDEIKELETGLFQTQKGYSSNFLITGERGIGKSSLMMLLKYVADGNLTTFDNEKFNFLVINIVISDETDLPTMIKLIEKKITRELTKIEKLKTFIKDTWEFVKRIKVMDSGINSSEKDSEIDILMDDFAYSLSETCKRITSLKEEDGKKDGIVFLLDECDKSSDNLKLGYFIKMITELLQQNDCNNIMFTLAGLPDTVEKLTLSHESSLRALNHIKISELSPIDRKYVIEKGIEEANEINSVKTIITDEAKEHISTLSEGYPHFIQQFAFSAFESNDDGEISEDDVLNSAFKQGGAIDAIGSRYYANAYHDQIKSDDYRQVLSIMAESMNSWIKKSEIREKFNGTENTLNNALQALTTRKIILKNSSKVGEYRLQQKGFALWIKLFGDRQKQE